MTEHFNGLVKRDLFSAIAEYVIAISNGTILTFWVRENLIYSVKLKEALFVSEKLLLFIVN